MSLATTVHWSRIQPDKQPAVCRAVLLTGNYSFAGKDKETMSKFWVLQFATNQFSQALEIAPHDPFVLHELGVTAFQSGQFEVAVLIYRLFRADREFCLFTPTLLGG